ncbi:hypothetical protein OTU49_004506 [Cherax quadricarinatus]|uniref:Uncharacterized protein n=1 Tax=Cherax quadricarinatus TaxID=27406 RepID=A0AAW0XCQ9_CHEQU
MASVAVLVTVVCVITTLCFQNAAGAPAAFEMGERYDDLLTRQQLDLKSMGCQPVLQKVVLADQLEVHDDLVDYRFFPEVVAVNRCLEECSFCGSHRLGKQKGHCLPDPENVTERPFIVFYIEGGERHYREVLVTEHASCSCR